MKKHNRVTINLPELVVRWAEELMAVRGFDNRSAYFADLIRRDKERQDEKQTQRKAETIYDAPRDTTAEIRVEEKPRPDPGTTYRLVRRTPSSEKPGRRQRTQSGEDSSK
jgi:Arc/MetJ-type ribon-helix-helix transcriptional regulator